VANAAGIWPAHAMDEQLARQKDTKLPVGSTGRPRPHGVRACSIQTRACRGPPHHLQLQGFIWEASAF
jgi:hypothetical protein